MLGERRSNSLFAPAAPAEPERKPEQAEVHDISFEERTGRSLFAEATTAPRASELFFAPQEKGVTFAEALSQVQGYLSETYATLITEDNSDAKEQMKRRMARYLQENRIAVDGMTASELVDALYTEMAEYGFLTKYIFADGIEEIDINSWRDIEIQYSDGHTAKLEEHFDSPEHAANVIRRMLQNSGKVLDNASPIITSRLAKNIRISVIKTPVLDEDAGVAASIRINQRDEGIDLHGVSGALMATTNMQMQTFVTQPDDTVEGFDGYNGDLTGDVAATLGANCGMSTGRNGVMAFAANQRDEVRDLHDVAGALNAQPGMKQQTFVAAAFSAGAGASAGSIGYGEELAPTLKGSASGNCMPSVLCLNDQGGSVMECSEDVSGTLRAQEHGHQPLVYENHGIDARYTGPHQVVPTMSARYGTGGNNVPLVEQEETFCITGNAIDRQPQNGGNGIGYQRDIAYTLTATDHLSGYPDKRSNPED